MSSFRDILWGYPQGIINFVALFSSLFRILAGIVTGILIFFVIALFVNSVASIRVFGQELKYGIVGSVSQINPLDVSTDESSQLITSLIYSGLVSIDSQSGRITPELAETWEISPDGRKYTIFLRENIYWHDGELFTAEDVVNTYKIIQSGGDDTVLGAIMTGVQFQAIGDYQVQFTLPQVNAAFLELITIGILPEHLFRDYTYSRLVEQGDTISPIGTGPYQYVQKLGNKHNLRANQKYFKGAPEIKEISFTEFQTYAAAEVAFLKGTVMLLAPLEPAVVPKWINAATVASHVSLKKYVQANNTRVILFNLSGSLEEAENESLLVNIQLRQALAQSIDKNALVATLPGAKVAQGPFDSNSYVYNTELDKLLQFSQEDANKVFDKLGWKYEYSGAPFRTQKEKELGATLTFLDTPVNRQVAQNIRDQLLKVGFNLTLEGVTSENMQEAVIAKKEFEMLLFEIHSGIDPDQYGLWHSSQTTFPGLNLGGYKSTLVDNYLEKGRLQINAEKRLVTYKDFQKALVTEVPAIFLYHPSYYEVSFDIIDRKVSESFVDPSDRFSNIHTWKLVPGWRNWQTR